MVNLSRPWLLLSAEKAHKLSPFFLPVAALFGSKDIPEWCPLKWENLNFKNRIGLAGGVDKDALQIKSWWQLGAGFLEVGTVTPQPQKANPGRVVDRDLKSQTVWNRLGFPSQGVQQIKVRLNQLSTKKTPIFINVGKNRATPNENAVEDYKAVIFELDSLADAFVINISSPNTSQLRELLRPEQLRPFLILIRQFTQKPLLLKLSPDASNEEICGAIDIAYETKINGVILTNTTLAREPNSPYPADGGVSGASLSRRSKDVLKLAIEHLGPRKSNFLVISVGGILSAEDAKERIDLGADLVQIYSALIFNGPFFILNCLRRLKARNKIRG